MASSLLQATTKTSATGAAAAPPSGGEAEEWIHTQSIWRNLPAQVIKEVEAMPEVVEVRGGCGVRLLPCLRTQLQQGIWYRDDPRREATRKQPADANDYFYARVVTLATYHRVLGLSSVRSILSVIGHYSLLNMACEVAASREYAHVPPGFRAAFVACVALPVVVWGTMCGQAAWRELKSHQKTGDYAVHKWMELLKDLVNIFIFQLLAIPRSVKDAPILYHPRKPTQPFCATKIGNRRMWILGYLCEAQSLYEEEQGQEHQLPLYLCHIPALVLQAYIALCLGAWCASSVLTMMVSFPFLFINLINVANLRRKKSVYQNALQAAAESVVEKISENSHKDSDLDKLGTLDKLLGQYFGLRCSKDQHVLDEVDAYIARTFLGQKPTSPNPAEGGDEEEDEEEYCALLGLHRAACCFASKASSRDDGSRGSSRTCNVDSRESDFPPI